MSAVPQTLAAAGIAFAALVFGAGLRFSSLDSFPLHADEATGARLVGYAMESGESTFDPTHFHGPLLHAAGATVSRITGATGWNDLEIRPLRLVPAAAGLVLCLLPLAALPVLGRVPALWAVAFLAVSPFLVHFSRVYIHESLLALVLGASLVALAVWWQRPLAWIAVLSGALLALAAATKETFVITVAAWALAALVLRHTPAAPRIVLVRHAALAALAFGVVLWAAYSDGGKNPAGVFDFVRTYWSYELGAGHEKSPGYYAGLLLFPHWHGRLWWWTGGIFFLALAGCLPGGCKCLPAIRFLVLSALAQVLVYSLIAYKTPWLMLVPWAHVVAAAGLSAARFLAMPAFGIRWIAAAVIFLLLGVDAVQSHRAVFRFPSDERNPFCYVPTASRIEQWTRRSIDWLRDADAAGETVAIVGPHYWPLPWYLRSLPQVGYWDSLPDGASALPMLVAMPQVSPQVAEILAPTHVALPEGLRTETPVLVFIRNDIWEKSTELPAQ